MNRLTWLLILLVTSQSALANNSCEVEGYAIGFFNGVATTRMDAERGKDEIKSTLNIDEYKSEKVEYRLFYNDSYIDGSGFNVLADFAETFDQRTQELEQKQFDRWEAFWDIVNGRQDSSIIQKISAAFSWFGGFVADFISQSSNVIIREFLEALTLLVDAPETEKTQMKHNLINDSNTWKGKKLIYIAHSQGNLWVNKSYNHVVSQLGYDANNIHVVHIAPASPTLSPDSDYILSTSDLVINGLNFTGIGSVPPPNTVVAPSSSDITGHGLVEIYLTHPDLIEKIKASVKRAFSSLAKPDMEDYLFEVTYHYTPTFAKSHASPEILFVDNPNDDWKERASLYADDYSYLKETKPYQNDYKLNPKNDFEALLFEHDNTDRLNQVISIVQCSDIPNNDPFILGEQSTETIRYGWDKVPPNTKASITVRDRYGFKLQTDEVSINEVRAKGWQYHGIFLDIKAVSPYKKEEKAFIKQNKLETKYNLYSDSIIFASSS
ncbi:hypothetical protein AKG98_3341 [Moritella sp. JT01]|uniref:hypothetical protein n=1 Tax=Moritella sp. JT01 TaxID=756698 RepID=UPI00079A03BF|nr:hypothetical protein [Moritella sp. JT01]KXO13125.1 hypothetical protein AKG98_3341 [Moritella sp. JT01]